MPIGVVLAGGEQLPQLVPPRLRDATVLADAVIVAADSGIEIAHLLPRLPDALVGDLDSVTPAALAWARERNIVVEEHPAAKDETDFELAVRHALRRGATELVVLGGAGGRLDHLFANLAALAGLDVRAEAWLGEQFAAVVDATIAGRWSATLPLGQILSVLPWGGAAVVSETGVRWPLDHRRIEPGETLGVSNESLGGVVTVTVHDGRALVVVPQAVHLTEEQP